MAKSYLTCYYLGGGGQPKIVRVPWRQCHRLAQAVAYYAREVELSGTGRPPLRRKKCRRGKRRPGRVRGQGVARVATSHPDASAPATSKSEPRREKRHRRQCAYFAEKAASVREKYHRLSMKHGRTSMLTGIKKGLDVLESRAEQYAALLYSHQDNYVRDRLNRMRKNQEQFPGWVQIAPPVAFTRHVPGSDLATVLARQKLPEIRAFSPRVAAPKASQPPSVAWYHCMGKGSHPPYDNSYTHKALKKLGCDVAPKCPKCGRPMKRKRLSALPCASKALPGPARQSR